jgi:hypothetical protein
MTSERKVEAELHPPEKSWSGFLKGDEPFVNPLEEGRIRKTCGDCKLPGISAPSTDPLTSGPHADF